MGRWILALVFGVFALAASDARAQVFKPRTQTKTTTTTKAAPKKTPAAAPRKTSRTTGGRKTSKSRAARDKGRPSDLTPDPKNDDEDVVIIVDEDED